MSSYTAAYDEYLTAFYTVLANLALMAAVMVIGYYILKAIYKKDSARPTYEFIYLVTCAGIVIFIVSHFFGG